MALPAEGDRIECDGVEGESCWRRQCNGFFLSSRLSCAPTRGKVTEGVRVVNWFVVNYDPISIKSYPGVLEKQ